MYAALYYIGTLCTLMMLACIGAWFFENTEIGDKLFEKIMDKLEVEIDE